MARAYTVWRIDCDECGEVYDCDGADEPDRECENCGAEVEVEV